jgi:hypothetical protein
MNITQFTKIVKEKLMISQIFLLLSNWPKYFINCYALPLQGKHIVIVRSIATPDFRSHFVLGYIWGGVGSSPKVAVNFHSSP